MKTTSGQNNNPKRLFKLQKLWIRVSAVAREQSINMSDALDILVSKSPSISISDVSELRQIINQSEQKSSGSISWKSIVSGGGGPGTGKRR